MEEESTFPNSFYETSITLISKLGKDLQENYRPIFIMIIGVKILNKLLTN